MRERGFSLIELLIVIAVMGIIMAIATYYWGQMQLKSAVESEARKMYADLMNIRMQALYRKTSRSVIINGTQFNVYSSAVTTVAPIVTKQLPYPMVWNGSGTAMTFDAQGLMNGSSDRTLCILPTNDTTIVNAAYVDSLVVSRTRINLGKRTGGDCTSGNIEQK